MPVATVTSKGQVTIPKDVREELGIETGSKLRFVRTPEGDFVIKLMTRSVRRLRGSVAYDGPPVSVEQMNADIGKAVSEEHGR